MSRGRRYPAESREAVDAATGRRVRQITSHSSTHHHPFFFVPAYDQAMKRLVFVSYRTGRPQIFFEDRANGELVQATDRNDLAEWSIVPSNDGRYVYFTAGTNGFRVDLDSFEEEQLADLSQTGTAGIARGATALSVGGQWWAVPIKSGPGTRLMLIDTEKKTSSVVLERDTIRYPQFCPDDDDLILYANSPTDRVWLTDRSGAKNRRLYQREDKMQWVTHEVWVPGRRTVAFVDWPRGMKMVDVDRGVVRQITYSPAWHAAPDDAGERFVCDTNFPDRGLHTFEVDGDPADDAELLCASEASSDGKHWGGPFPYNDGPPATEAAQQTHPHPRFSPDGERVVFTSDRTGHAQIYEVTFETDR